MLFNEKNIDDEQLIQFVLYECQEFVDNEIACDNTQNKNIVQNVVLSKRLNGLNRRSHPENNEYC